MNDRIYAPDPEADYYNTKRQFDVPRSFIGTGYTNWWTAAWREGNLLVAGANMISEAYQHSQYDQNTEFVKDFAQNKERYLGSFAQYEDKYAALSAPKSLEHLEFTKRLIARNVRERAKLNSVGFTDGLLPFLAIGTVSPENWVPLAGAARLGFLGKASLGMRGLQKAFPSIKKNAAKQLDEIMTPAFVNQAKAAFPGISQEAI